MQLLRPLYISVRRCDPVREIQVKRGRERPVECGWMEALWKDLCYFDHTEDLILNGVLCHKRMYAADLIHSEISWWLLL